MGVVTQGHAYSQSKAAAYGRQMMPQNNEYKYLECIDLDIRV